MCNPTYEEHTAWWDVLCNIETGKITVSKDIEVTRLNSISSMSGDIENASTAFASLALGRSSGGNAFSGSLGKQEARERDWDTEFMNDVSGKGRAPGFIS